MGPGSRRTYGLSEETTSVDVDQGTRKEAGGVTGQKCDHSGDLLGRAVSRQRRLPAIFFHAIGRGKLFVVTGLNYPRHDRIHAHLRCKLSRQGSSKDLKSAFGGRIGPRAARTARLHG